MSSANAPVGCSGLRTPSDPDVEALKERGWRELAAIDEALERGELDEAGWHRAVADLIRPAYLGAETPYGQSGKFGDDAAAWERSRRLVVDAVDRDGTFLDVGCANGLLMETVRAWAAEDGHAVEPYGLEIVPELAELARLRLPGWRDRIFIGNGLDWSPPRRFDFIRTGLDYVPRRRRSDLIEHLVRDVCEPGGRLIVGVFNEEIERRALEEEVAGWGFAIAGRTERPHRDPRIAYRAFWIDAPGVAVGS